VRSSSQGTRCEDLDAALPDLLDGLKDPDVEAHLASCTTCRARFAELAQIASAVADLADRYRPPADAEAALQRAMYERLRRRRAGVNPGWLAVAAAVGAVCTLLFVRPPLPPAPSAVGPRTAAPAPSSAAAAAPPAPLQMPRTSSPDPSLPRKRLRDAVAAARKRPPSAGPIEPVLDALADVARMEDPPQLDSGFYADEIRSLLLPGLIGRAQAAAREGRWLEACEDARLAHRLDRQADEGETFLLRCDAEAERIAVQAGEVRDRSARRSMLGGALLIATPGSPVYQAIEARLAPPMAVEGPQPAAGSRGSY